MSEKFYTPEEANAILLKATREKIEAFEAEIKTLRERELSKSIIPSHNHNEASQASSGTEDVPAAMQKVAPPGFSEKTMHKLKHKYGTESAFKIAWATHNKAKKAMIEKNALQGYGAAPGNAGAGMAGGPGGSVIAGPTAGPMQMSELCKTCGMKKAMCKCMGKTELVDAQGKHSNSTKVTDTDKTSREYKAGQVDAGKVQPGKDPKKAGPVTKQPVNDTQNDAGKVSNLVEKKAGNKGVDSSSIVKLIRHAVKGGKPKDEPHAVKDASLKGKAKDSHLTQGSKEKFAKAECPKCGEDHKGVDHATAVLMGPDPKVLHPSDKKVKKADVPTAKPPSGQNMGTGVPMSKPKLPMVKAGLPGSPKAQMQQHGLMAGSKAAAMGGAPGAAPAVKPPMPSPQQHAQRAATHQAALGGAFTPKGPVSSGLELAHPPRAPGVGGLKPPPAAVKPAPRPGIFGKLGMGKSEGRPEVVPQNSPEEKKFREDNKAATAAGKKGVPVKPGDGVAKTAPVEKIYDTGM